MAEYRETHVSTLKIRSAKEAAEPPRETAFEPEWYSKPPAMLKDHFLRNLCVASALVLCAVSLRSGALPELTGATDAVFTAATDQSLLDEKLGKLSFVSSLFPEAVLVFGEENSSSLMAPVNDGIITHAWTESEPYTSWQSASRDVMASTDGEVTGIYHGYGDEWIAEISSSTGQTWLYGNLEYIDVRLGDYVSAGMNIGRTLTGEDCVLEVRKNGISFDPETLVRK